MKRFSILIIGSLVFSLVLLASCHSNGNKADQQKQHTTTSARKGTPKIKFLKTSYNFGEISEGEEPVFYFKFVNTGTANLYISDVQTSCGCTVAQYPDKPIPPGDTEQIVVTFNSSGYSGYQIKKITIFANTPKQTHSLTIEGVVK